jgi:hypothetical protein
MENNVPLIEWHGSLGTFRVNCVRGGILLYLLFLTSIAGLIIFKLVS